MRVFPNSAWCSRVEVGRVCVQLQGEFRGVTREAGEHKVGRKWGVGGSIGEAWMWSFSSVELTSCDIGSAQAAGYRLGLFNTITAALMSTWASDSCFSRSKLFPCPPYIWFCFISHALFSLCVATLKEKEKWMWLWRTKGFSYVFQLFLFIASFTRRNKGNNQTIWMYCDPKLSGGTL